MERKNQKGIIAGITVFLLFHPTQMLGCPCFHADYIYSTFKAKTGTYCTNTMTNDFFGGMQTRVYTVSIVSQNNYAVARLNKGAGVNGASGFFINGSCELNANYDRIQRTYEYPAQNQMDCAQAILSACQSLNIEAR